MKKRCRVVDDGRRVIFDPPLGNKETIVMKAECDEGLKIKEVRIKKEKRLTKYPL